MIKFIAFIRPIKPSAHFRTPQEAFNYVRSMHNKKPELNDALKKAIERRALKNGRKGIKRTAA